MADFTLNIVTPDQCLFQGQARQILLRTVLGDVCILPDHIDYAAALGTGLAVVTDAEGKERRAACSGGMVTVNKNAVSVMAVTFEWGDMIDMQRAQAAKERAEKQLSAVQKTDSQYDVAEAKLKRALTRIQAGSK